MDRRLGRGVRDRGGMVPRNLQADEVSALLGRDSRRNPGVVRACQSDTHTPAHHPRPGGHPVPQLPPTTG
jgi:hypothetical protein